MNWIEKDTKLVWHPFSPLKGVAEPLLIKSAKGVYLETEDRRVIDAISSWWVNLHGHSHPYIARAVAEQAATLEHVIFAGFTHQPAIQLAENLLSILPDNQTKIFYSDNGSTAVEVAIKMCFQYWYNKNSEKKTLVAIDGAYHGDTFGAMSVGERGGFTKPFASHLFDVEFIDFPDGTNDEEVLSHFENLTKSNRIAGFIYEPLIQGASGMRIYSEETLSSLLAIAKDNDILCIADEVMTGFGRTGKLFASDYIDAKPDIICLSKGLTGGTMALGATSCTQGIIDAFYTEDLYKAFLHGHSFTANPIACASANASYDLLMAPECQEAIARISKQQAAFVQRLEGHDKLVNIRSIGTVLALEFITDNDNSYFSEMRNSLYPYFLERNILLRPLGNLIYVLPPYVITADELSYVHQEIVTFVDGL